MDKRILIKFEYLGTNFCGYQKQPNKRTVQGEIEQALFKILGIKLTIYASGRTDAGVHSRGSFAHFDLDEKYSVDVRFLAHKLNEHLPEDISVHFAKEVPLEFDSRFSVKKKSYSYNFYLSRHERAIYKSRALRVNDNVKIEPMQSACKYLLGTHDFTSFVARKSGKTDFVRTIYSAEIVSLGDNLYSLEISGNGFLYNMVRIIMGTLIDIGCGRKHPEDMKAIIEGKNRALAGKTVTPEGLYMARVEY